jgi:hypothetical protein
MKTRANTSELNKKPLKVRYVFVIEYLEEMTTLTTHQALRKFVNKSFPCLDVIIPEAYIKVVDLSQEKIYELKITRLGEFLDEWRGHYFDYGWDLPDKFKVI